MAFTKFKLLAERLLSGLGRSKTFFPFYDSQNDADYRVSLDTLITFISNELGVSSKAVFEIMQPIIGELKHEEFWVIYLNNANKIVHKTQLSKGGITGTSWHKTHF